MLSLGLSLASVPIISKNSGTTSSPANYVFLEGRKEDGSQDLVFAKTESTPSTPILVRL